MSVDLGACLSYGFERLQRNPVYIVVGMLLIGIINSIVPGILFGPLMVGFMRGLMKEDQGGQAELGDIFSGFNDFVPALVAGLLSLVAISIGMMLFIIPGLLVAPIMWLSLYEVARGEKDGIEALKKAWANLQQNLVTLALATFVIGLVGGLGALLCGVGALLTMPPAMAALYKMAQQGSGAATPVQQYGFAGPGAPSGPPMGPPKM